MIDKGKNHKTTSFSSETKVKSFRYILLQSGIYVLLFFLSAIIIMCLPLYYEGPNYSTLLFLVPLVLILPKLFSIIDEVFTTVIFCIDEGKITYKSLFKTVVLNREDIKEIISFQANTDGFLFEKFLVETEWAIKEDYCEYDRGLLLFGYIEKYPYTVFNKIFLYKKASSTYITIRARKELTKIIDYYLDIVEENKLADSVALNNNF